MSRRQEIIRQAKRRQYEQYRQTVNQLNELHARGYSDEQIRNAGNNAYKKLSQEEFLNAARNRQPASYTIADGDTLSTIAQQFNTTEADLLSANPDMRNLKTGMVINTSSAPIYRPRTTSETVVPWWGLGWLSFSNEGQTYNETAAHKFFRRHMLGIPDDPSLTPIYEQLNRQYPSKPQTAQDPFTGYWWGVKIGNPSFPPSE